MSKAVTRCKMVVNVAKTNDAGTHDVILSPVCGASDDASDENKKYWEYTPCGELRLDGLKNMPAVEVGKEYYVDIIPAAE